jgi:Putative Flp pilus-assembly TadE/G-like
VKGMSDGTRRRQSGQVMVLIAGGMVAILAMVALVLMGGASYWERRHLQELADSAVLAASIKAGGPCSTAQAMRVADMARNVLEAQLGPRTSGPTLTPGTCPRGTGYIVSYGFADGTTADINWPYALHGNDYVMATLKHKIPLQLPGFVGNSANIGAYAIAQANGVKHPRSFALYAYDGINCGGAGINTITGSIYSGGPIDTNCSLWAKHVDAQDPNNPSATITVDYGDIVVFPPNQQWNRGKGNCGDIMAGKASNAICSDGYEESGDPADCAATFPPGTSYLQASQLQPDPNTGIVPNPSPCSLGDKVAGPVWDLTADPNYGSNAAQFGAPCPVGFGVTTTTYPTATFPGAKGPAMRASAAVIAAAATKPDAKGLWHFHPGCYAWIDVANVPGGTAVLDPGFYFFNGFYDAKDPSGVGAGGIALNGSKNRLLGQDVTLEFANPAGGASSLSGTEIYPASKTASACGTSQICYLGADPNKNGGGIDVGAPYDRKLNYLAAPCDPNDSSLRAGCSAPSSWCPKTDASCYDVLVWAPSPANLNTEPAVIGGSFWFKGTGSFEWMYGKVEWPGNCAWSANDDSILIGSMICDTANIQGGSIAKGPGVLFPGTGDNNRRGEPGLKA